MGTPTRSFSIKELIFMGITRALFQNLLNDGEVIISPYDPKYLISNTYELHNDGRIGFYDYEKIYGFSVAVDSENPPKLKADKIPKNGWCLEPNKVYYLSLKENIICPKYATTIATHADLSKFGLIITMEDSPAYGEDGSEFDISLTTAHPLVIYPEQRIASLTLDAGDAGTSAIPIGGIIAWRGGPLPYGYCYCDGSYGSPNLIGHVIVGGTSNAFLGPVLDACHPAKTEHTLLFIMRYK